MLFEIFMLVRLCILRMRVYLYSSSVRYGESSFSFFVGTLFMCYLRRFCYERKRGKEKDTKSRENKKEQILLGKECGEDVHVGEQRRLNEHVVGSYIHMQMT